VLELLRDIPDDYENTKALRAEASYYKAQTAFRQEEWETVINLLKDLDRESLKRKYRDIENLYLEACSKAGVSPDPTPEPGAGGESVSSEEEPREAVPTETATPAPTPEPNPFLVTEDE
jgi:hypothetical protein